MLLNSTRDILTATAFRVDDACRSEGSPCPGMPPPWGAHQAAGTAPCPWAAPQKPTRTWRISEAPFGLFCFSYWLMRSKEARPRPACRALAPQVPKRPGARSAWWTGQSLTKSAAHGLVRPWSEEARSEGTPRSGGTGRDSVRGHSPGSGGRDALRPQRWERHDHRPLLPTARPSVPSVHRRVPALNQTLRSSSDSL